MYCPAAVAINAGRWRSRPVPPHRVRALYREWAHSLEQGPVPGEHVLGDGAELDVLAAAAEDLFARKG